MNSDAEWEVEEARDRLFWKSVLHVVWTGVIVLGVAGALWGMTLASAWRDFVVLGVLGVLAGACIALATGRSSHHRPWAGLVFGGITLPFLAAYLGSTSAQSPDVFRSTSRALAVFFAYGLAAFFAVLWLSSVWRRGAIREPPNEMTGADAETREGAAP
jgi:hypothetical protein